MYAFISVHSLCLNQIPHFSRIFDWVSRRRNEPAFNSFESLRIDLDVAFHMHRIELFDSAHVKFDV